MDTLMRMDESNVTGNLDGGKGQPKTPKFKGELDPDAIDDEMEVVDDKEDEEENEEEEMSLFKKYFYELYGNKHDLNEATYRQFKNDTTITNKRKLNNSLKHVNGQLQTIELILDQNIKLKGEKGLASTDIWGTTKKSVNNINKRIARIQTKIMKLMS